MKILNNGIAVLEGDTHISKWVIQEGRLDHDQSMLPVVLPLIRPGDTVVDAGAFIGDHTIAYARAVGSAGKMLAFEPNPKAYDCLIHNMKEYPQVEAHCMGLGETNSWHKVVEHPNAGMAYLDGSNQAGSAIVTVMSLDKVMEKTGTERLNFMKIDCEGFEVDILCGAKESILRFQPIMLIEINVGALQRRGHNPGVVFDFLTSLKYTYANVFPGQPMTGDQFDILCLPEGFVI